MIHAREDYNRIQDPAGKIAENEPVFLLRAKDAFAPATVRCWARMVADAGDEDLATSVNSFADFMEEWQRANGCKMPDTPNDEKWSK